MDEKGEKKGRHNEKNWQEIEEKFLPVIKKKAKKIGGISASYGLEDAIQEGRIALLAIVEKYDSKKGPLEFYAKVCLENFFRGVYRDMTLKKRAPHEGQLIPYQEDLLVQNEKIRPDLLYERCEAGIRVDDFCSRIFEALPPKEKCVFDCRVNPPGNLKGGSAPPAIPDIAQYLGVSKNSVDYSMLKIKSAFSRLLDVEEFSDLFECTSNDLSINWKKVPEKWKKFLEKELEKKQ